MIYAASESAGTPVSPECRPSRRSSIQQIVFTDSRWSAAEVPLDFGEGRVEKSEPLG
jgi:hypothetical protein